MDPQRILTVTLFTFLVMILVWNLNRRLPRIPIDPYVDKFGFGLYIPLFSSLIISVVILMLLTTLKV